MVISPTSVAIALAMARAGARGQTAAEMDTVLRSFGSDDHGGWIRALEQGLDKVSGTVATGRDSSTASSWR